MDDDPLHTSTAPTAPTILPDAYPAPIAAILKREGVVGARQLADRRWLLLVPRIANAGLLIDRGLDDGMWEEEYSYQYLDQALVALAVWDPDEQADPDGWLRHIPSYRRRPGGDATKEEIRE